MDLVRTLISVGRYVREENKIKVRQPLSEALIDGKNEALIGDLIPLIKEELNVKKVTFADDLSKYMNFTVKPNFKVVGKILGAKIKEFGNALESLNDEEIAKLNNNEEITVKLSNEDFVVTNEMVDIRISSKEGFNVGMENKEFIILNTELSHELLLEGIAREFISKVQNMRKSEDFNISDRINVAFSGDEMVEEALDVFNDLVKGEILALELINDDNSGEVIDLNGHNATISIRKA